MSKGTVSIYSPRFPSVSKPENKSMFEVRKAVVRIWGKTVPMYQVV
jgi:hypothetical protein